MKARSILYQIPTVVFFAVMVVSCGTNTKTELDPQTGFIDVLRARVEIEALGKQFSEKFTAKDSVALARMYSTDGMLGSVQGHDALVSAFHRMLTHAVENETPTLLFTTHSVTTDDEFVVELGIAQWIGKEGQVKSEGKYLVVWKQEDGAWKIYRDWGL